MGQGRSILKNTLIYAVGNFGSKALTFLLLPLYSFYLTKDEFGMYDLIIVTINLLAPMITLQTSEAVYRWLIDAKDNSKQQSKIVLNGLIIVSLIAVIFYIIYFFLSLTIHFEYTGYFALMLLFSCYLPLFQKILRGLGKTSIFSISGIVYTLLFLVFTLVLLVYFDKGIESLFLASIVSGSVTIVYIIFNLNLKGVFSKEHIDRKEIGNMIKYSLPLVPNSISWWFINAADKYLILLILNIEANGIYAVSTRFPAVITLVNSIFLLAWQDYGIGAKEASSNTAFFSRLFDKFITLELTLVLFLISISQYLVSYLIDPIYYESWKYLPFLFIGVAFQAFSSYVGVGYQRAKKTRNIFTTSLAGGIINIVISLSLLNHIGLFAPALGTFVSFLVMYMLRKHQTNSFFKIDVNNPKLISLTAFAILFAFLVLLKNDYLNIVLILISSLAVLLLNKKLISELLIIIREQASKLIKN